MGEWVSGCRAGADPFFHRDMMALMLERAGLTQASELDHIIVSKLADKGESLGSCVRLLCLLLSLFLSLSLDRQRES